MPEDLLVQVERIEQVLDCFGIERFRYQVMKQMM